jgi:hypothetical protein
MKRTYREYHDKSGLPISTKSTSKLVVWGENNNVLNLVQTFAALFIQNS